MEKKNLRGQTSGAELKNYGYAVRARHAFLPHEGNGKGTPGLSHIQRSRLVGKFELSS